MPDSFLVPIVLGVVGHRDIDPEKETVLINAVRQILQEFRKTFPSSPLVLLSNLAEGADQLAVQAALAENEAMKRKNREIPESDLIKIQAPLPFPPEVYLQSTSFKNKKSKILFDELFSKSKYLVVPLPDGHNPDSEAEWKRFSKNDDLRYQCYANAGGYIVRHCLALIALWDDNPTGQPSGTAELVQFKLKGIPPPAYPWHGPLRFGSENGPVFHIFTPRSAPAPAAGSPSPLPNPYNLVPGSIQVLLPESSSTLLKWRFKQSVSRRFEFLRRMIQHNEANSLKEYRQFYETCKSIENYNRDVLKHKPHFQAGLGSALRKMVGEIPEGLGRGNDEFNSVAQFREVPAFLAKRFDKKLLWLEGLVFVVWLWAAFFFHAYAHHLEMEVITPTIHYPGLLFVLLLSFVVRYPWSLLAFLSSLLISGIVVIYVQRRKLDVRRLDYRAFAEALRVRFYWGLAGIGRSVADTYLGQLRSEMAWIRRALQNSRPEPGFWRKIFNERAHNGQLNCLRIVKENWVKEQLKFYEKKTNENRKFAATWRYLGIVLAILGWLLALALCLGWIVPCVFNPHHPKPWILVLSGMLVVTGGLFIVYSERRSFKELSKQYERLAIVFSRGDKEMETHLNNRNVAGAQDVIEELGREALAEHAQWLILRRARPFELHIGG